MASSLNKRYFKGSCKKVMRYFKEYCDYTGIHGFRYVAEERTLYERMWWIISVGLSVTLCGLMVNQIFKKYINYPMIVTFSMQEMLLSEIPFPAVTVCPTAKISQDYFNITEAKMQMENKSLDEETEKMYNFASTICNFYPSFYVTEEGDNGTSLFDFYNFLEMSKVQVILTCEYQDLLTCTFIPVLTQDGLCYTYNILDKRDMYRENVSSISNYHSVKGKTQWDIENGYENASKLWSYPRRVYRQGYNNGLKVYMYTKISDIENDCVSDETGYRVTISLPSKFPQTSDSFITVPLNQMVIGQITPHMIKTSPGVQRFDPIKRRCYFQSERLLKFFKIYSQENCLFECLTNVTLKICGCVGFHMPRYNNTPVCILRRKDCMERAERLFNLFTIRLTVENSKKFGSWRKLLKCDCLPTCTDLTYNVEISQNIVRPKNPNQKEGYVLSILNLHFKKSHIETKERNEVYEFSDFISNFGGLLGLFTGFSILSLIEIIYFLSLRIWGNVKLYKNWSGKNS